MSESHERQRHRSGRKMGATVWRWQRWARRHPPPFLWAPVTWHMGGKTASSVRGRAVSENPPISEGRP